LPCFYRVTVPEIGTRCCLSVVAWFQLMKTIIGTEAVRSGDRDMLVGHLEEVCATLIMPRL